MNGELWWLFINFWRHFKVELLDHFHCMQCACLRGLVVVHCAVWGEMLYTSIQLLLQQVVGISE